MDFFFSRINLVRKVFAHFGHTTHVNFYINKLFMKDTFLKVFEMVFTYFICQGLHIGRPYHTEYKLRFRRSIYQTGSCVM